MSYVLSRWRALDGAERWLLVRATLRLTTVALSLRVLGFQRLAAAARRPTDAVVAAEDRRRARRYARWLAVAARHHVIPARCLHRSLTLHRWLRDEGLPSTLQIGVRKDGEALRAHAWVELGGVTIDDEPASVAAFSRLVGAALSNPSWERASSRSAGRGTARLAFGSRR